MDFTKFLIPFPESHIEWRLAQCGKKNDGGVWGTCLAYIQARAIMDRLDEVAGPARWKAEYSFIGTAGVICKLSVKVENEWVTKEDGAEATDIEPFKGGISGALKRAAVLWGIGRYLYDLESGFIQEVDKKATGARYGKTKDGAQFYWIPPRLPAWALPGKPSGVTPPPAQPAPPSPSQSPVKPPAPLETPLVMLRRVVKEFGVGYETDVYCSEIFGLTDPNKLTVKQIGELINLIQRGAIKKRPVDPNFDAPEPGSSG